jgi:hypothetical protein
VAITALLLVLALPGAGQSPAQKAAEDAMVVRRVAEASERDLPVDLLKRIVEEDIDLLRGRRADGSFEWAEWERFEASRKTVSESVQPSSEQMETIEAVGENVYRVIVDVPERRMLIRRNRPVWVERIDVEYVVDAKSPKRRQTIEVKQWMQPGELKPFDLDAIARQAHVRVIATADPAGGYGNIDVSLVQARLVDLPRSPYAPVVTHAKSVLASLAENDAAAVRAAAERMRQAAEPRVTAAPAPAARDTAAVLELQAELQEIERLLQGSATERSEGLERLRVIIRNLRP